MMFMKDLVVCIILTAVCHLFLSKCNQTHPLATQEISSKLHSFNWLAA